MTEISSISKLSMNLPQISVSSDSGNTVCNGASLFGDNLIGGTEDSYTSDAVKSQLKIQAQELVKMARRMNATSSEESGGSDTLKKSISTKIKALKEQAENAGVDLNALFSEISAEMNLSRKDQKTISKTLKVKITKSDKTSGSEVQQSNPFLSSNKPMFAGFSDIASASDSGSGNDDASYSTESPSFRNSPSVKLDKEFLDKTKDISQRIGCDYKDLLAVMNSESGLRANIVNKKGGATGLIQFLPSTAKMLGTTTDALAKMSPTQQLDYVEKFFNMTKKTYGMEGKKLSGADLYSLVFLPGRAKNDVLTRKGEIYYSPNSGLDLDKNGDISKADLAKRVARCYVDESKIFGVA